MIVILGRHINIYALSVILIHLAVMLYLPLSCCLLGDDQQACPPQINICLVHRITHRGSQEGDAH